MLQSQKIVAESHHNPGISLNFQKFQIFPVLEVNSLCKNIFLFGKFSLFSLSGKTNIKIPCSPCDVATLTMCTAQVEIHCCPEYTGSRLQ